jgi:hypothetical protein
MSVRDQQRQRKWVRQWCAKLLPLGRSVTDKNPGTALRKLHALNIALLETAIYGLSARDIGFAQTVVEDTLYSVLASYGEPNHRRSHEASMIRDEAAAALSDTPPARGAASAAKPSHRRPGDLRAR